MIDQNNFSIGACTLVPQITWPFCARDVIVDKVHCAFEQCSKIKSIMFETVHSKSIKDYA